MTKLSIRNKIDEAKEKIHNSFAEEDVSLDLKFAVEPLMILLDIIVVVLLEKKIRKNPSNSSLPPSRNIEKERIIGFVKFEKSFNTIISNLG